MTNTSELDAERQPRGVAPLKWLPVLMYHHVAPQRHSGLEYVEVTCSEFEEQMRYLKVHGYESVRLDEAAHGLVRGKGAVERPVVITFDDGYLDVFHYAVPILRKYGFTAQMFLISSRLGGTRGRTSSSSDHLSFLGADHLRELAAEGISFGSHSVTHRRLAELSSEEAWEEIRGSKLALEDILGSPIDSFSYPYGSITRNLQEMVKEAGYLAACGIEQGQHELYNLSRIDASRCRGADLRWRVSASGLYFRLRQRKSLRRIKGLLFGRKPERW